MRGRSFVHWLAILVLLLAGCGGGGGGSDPAPSAPSAPSATNAPPVALAGVDHEVNVGLPVTLDGRGSRGTDGTALSYTWTLTAKPEGSQATLSSSAPTVAASSVSTASIDPSRVTLIPDEPGTYEVTLVVDDGQASSEPSSILLTALPTFAAIYGGEAYSAITSIQEISDGCFILLGISSSYGSTDPSFKDHAVLIKTDRFGREIWSKALPAEMSSAVDVFETLDGGFIVGGMSEGSNTTFVDLCVLRTDAMGNLEWLRVWENSPAEHLHYISKTVDGNYLLVANSIDYSSQYPFVESILLLKIDIEGNEVWSKTVALDNGYFLQSGRLGETIDGGFVIASMKQNQLFEFEISLERFDNNGELLWSKTLKNTSKKYPNNISETSDGGFIIIGRDESGYSSLGFILKLDSDGAGVWMKNIDIEIMSNLSVIIENKQHEFIICGEAQYPISSTSNGLKAVLLKIDNNGMELSRNSLTLLPITSTYTMLEASDGSILVAGSCREFQIQSNMFLAKTDPDGNVNPMSTQISDVSLMAGDSVEIGLSQYFSDPNGDSLSYKVAGLPDGLLCDVATGRITGTVPAAESAVNYPLAVTATDPGGLIVSQTMLLQVTAH